MIRVWIGVGAFILGAVAWETTRQHRQYALVWLFSRGDQ